MSRRNFLASSLASVAVGGLGCANIGGRGIGSRGLRVPVDVPRPASLRAAWSGLRGYPAATGATLLTDNAAAWATRWQLLRTAQKTIDASYFIVEDDVFGLAFLGRLLERAEAGVNVRLLIDARGSQPLTLIGGDHLQELVQTGRVEVRVFNPIIPQVLTALSDGSPTPLLSGTHNKILIVDGARAITGGRNISRLYFSSWAEQAAAMADADVLLDGRDIVEGLQMCLTTEFSARSMGGVHRDLINLVPRREELLLLAAAMDIWLDGDCPQGPWRDAAACLERQAAARLTGAIDPNAAVAARSRFEALAKTTSVYGALPLVSQPRFDVEARVITAPARVSRSGAARAQAQRHGDDVNDALVRAVGGARKRILLESPYFIVTPRLLKALEAASARGVDIVLFTNSPMSSDNELSQALFIDSWPEVVARVPRLRVFAVDDGPMIHAKRAVFDDELTFIGSYNLDPFSAHMNSELMVASWSRRFAARSIAELEERLLSGRMVEYRIERGVDGVPRRAPASAHDTGTVQVRFGPAQHAPPEQIARLRTLKGLLLDMRSLWEFEVMVW